MDGAIFRPAGKPPVESLLAGLSRCCTEVRTKTVTTVAAKADESAPSQPGRASGLVEKSYFLLFLAAFFVEAFFVDFLAVFLAAAIKWLLRVGVL